MILNRKPFMKYSIYKYAAYYHSQDLLFRPTKSIGFSGGHVGKGREALSRNDLLKYVIAKENFDANSIGVKKAERMQEAA